MDDRINPECPHVFLLDCGVIVGFGKVLFVNGKPSTRIHNHDLSSFSKNGEFLIAIYKVQIYEEHVGKNYRYKFHAGFEELPAALGDMNDIQKCFGTQIAWDVSGLKPNPHGEEVGPAPQAIPTPIHLKQCPGLAQSVAQSQENSQRAVSFSNHVSVSVSLGKTRTAPVGVPLKRWESFSPAHKFACRKWLRDGERLETRFRSKHRASRKRLLESDDGSCSKKCRIEPKRSFTRFRGLQKPDSCDERFEPVLYREPHPSSFDTGSQNKYCDPVLEGSGSTQSANVSNFDKTVPPLCLDGEPHPSSSEIGIQLYDSESDDGNESTGNDNYSNFARCRPNTSSLDIRDSDDSDSRDSDSESGGNLGEMRCTRHSGYGRSATRTTGRNGTTDCAGDAECASRDANDTFNAAARDANAVGGEVSRLAFDIHDRIIAERGSLEQERYAPEENPRNNGKRVAGKRGYTYHVRARKEIQKTRLRLRRDMVAEETVNPFLTSRNCCKRWTCFEYVDHIFAFAQRKIVFAMNRFERKCYLNTCYYPPGKHFRFGGRPVCYRFLRFGMGFSCDLLRSVRGTELAPSSADPETITRDVQSPTGTIIEAYLVVLARRLGDFMPNENENTVCIPLYTRTQVYQKFIEFWNARWGPLSDKHPPSSCYFFRVWKMRCSNIRTRRTTSFQKCSVCLQFQEQCRKNLDNGRAMDSIRIARDQHLAMISEERAGYFRRQRLAQDDPHRHYSLIIDGAGQCKFGVPHFVEQSKSDKGHKIKVKLVAGLEHLQNDRKRLNVFAMTEEFATGADHIIETLHRILQGRKEEVRKLPPIFFLQLDNCTRENKNRYLLAYCELLVAQGVFKVVYVSFLPVGHTHADIDQSFSSISGKLRREDAATMEDLLVVLRGCYGGHVRAQEMLTIANFSMLCEHAKSTNDVRGLSFSNYRFFKFEVNEGVQCSNHHKTMCSVKIQETHEWKNLRSDRSGFLRCPPILSETPPTVTKVLPNFKEVSKCIAAADERIGNEEKLTSLYQLRDRVYTIRTIPFEWDLQIAVELNGDYRRTEDGEARQKHSEDSNYLTPFPLTEPGCATNNFGYNVDEFVALKAPAGCGAFWIARVKDVVRRDTAGAPVTLLVRWYQAGNDESDCYMAPYRPAWKMGSSGKRAVYEDSVDVDSVLVRFDRLTTSSRLHSVTRTKIRETLHHH